MSDALTLPAHLLESDGPKQLRSIGLKPAHHQHGIVCPHRFVGQGASHRNANALTGAQRARERQSEHARPSKREPNLVRWLMPAVFDLNNAERPPHHPPGHRYRHRVKRTYRRPGTYGECSHTQAKWRHAGRLNHASDVRVVRAATRGDTVDPPRSLEPDRAVQPR